MLRSINCSLRNNIFEIELQWGSNAIMLGDNYKLISKLVFVQTHSIMNQFDTMRLSTKKIKLNFQTPFTGQVEI